MVPFYQKKTRAHIDSESLHSLYLIIIITCRIQCLYVSLTCDSFVSVLKYNLRWIAENKNVNLFEKSFGFLPANLNVFKSNIAIHMTLIGGSISNNNNKKKETISWKKHKTLQLFQLTKCSFFLGRENVLAKALSNSHPNKIFKLHFSFGTFKWLLKFHQKCWVFYAMLLEFKGLIFSTIFVMYFIHLMEIVRWVWDIFYFFYLLPEVDYPLIVLHLQHGQFSIMYSITLSLFSICR